jgi:radical SAM superfamily enzyme YgiQ (UPF0313 family)
LEQLLARVEKPSRYIGAELFAEKPEPLRVEHLDTTRPARDDVCSPALQQAAENLDVALIYPDIYDIGASNQALVILYAVARHVPGVGVERAFLPWLDLAAELRADDLPLCSLESQRPLRDFDLLGITMPHELVATNICELLDLSGIALAAGDRGEDEPLVLGGGPVANSPAPFAAFFDALCIGEGEEAFAEVLASLRETKRQGLSRAERLKALADIEGLYVPSLTQGTVRRRVLADFASYPVVTAPVVPFVETIQDRLSIEIVRGCARGCRFCAAGMLNRPVRERSANTIVAAATQGLARTGLNEVALSSLSTTDHSHIAQILRRLSGRYDATDIQISLPSQRLDAFGVAMAGVVSGTQKKGSLTFAPEAGTQRLRDVINKNVSEADVLGALHAAYEAGWRRTKLYFMLGLPTETDEDVVAIAELANLAYATAKDAVPDEDRGKVRMSISVAVFVPKAHTPFQFCGQVPREELLRRVQLLKAARLSKGIDLRWHDPSASLVEAVFSRGDSSLAALGIRAWELGARFDAWSDQFDLAIWEEAAGELGLDLQELASRPLALDEALPWDFIAGGVSRQYLVREYERALSSAETTPDCTRGPCGSCGVCAGSVQTVLAGARG